VPPPLILRAAPEGLVFSLPLSPIDPTIDRFRDSLLFLRERLAPFLLLSRQPGESLSPSF